MYQRVATSLWCRELSRTLEIVRLLHIDPKMIAQEGTVTFVPHPAPYTLQPIH